MRPPAPKKNDALTLLARVGSARRRRSPIPLLISAAFLIAVLTFLAWFFWPTIPPGKLILVGFDEVAMPGEVIELKAGLDPLQDEDIGRDLSDFVIYFTEPGSDKGATCQTAHDGSASIRNFLPAGGATEEVVVRCPGTEERRGAPETTLKVFVWPADSKLLLVDAEHSLADGEAAKASSAFEPDLQPLAAASTTLQAAAGKCQIVYFTAEATRPLDYLKLRSWLRRAWLPQEQFPEGPLVKSSQLASLKSRFPSFLVAVTSNVSRAEVLHAAGFKTYFVGNGTNLPEGVIAVKSWSDLVEPLSK